MINMLQIQLNKRQSYCQKSICHKMDEESRNWFRFSKLIIDVGSNVLRKLVLENAQTSFLNDLVYFWLEKVHEIKYISYAGILLRYFYQDLNNKDETCRRSLRPLLKSWKLPVGHKMTFSEQLSILEKWKNDIEKYLSSSPSNVTDTLSSWLREIQNRIENLNFVSTILNTWTVRFLELCQQSQQDLLREIENHYDDFLSSSRDKVSKWSFLSITEVKKEITDLENDRKINLETWKKVSEMYFKSLEQNVKDLLTSWKEEFPRIGDIPELKELLDDFETETNEIDETKLQKSCDTWHQELHNLFKKWLKEIEKVRYGRVLLWMQHLETPLEAELRKFPSISSQQVKDFFVSENTKKKLQTLKQKKQLSDQQYCRLYPSSDFPDLKVCDTTLLFIVLRNCLVYPPLHGWNEDPPESDQSLGADILRLKSYRNDIVAHIEEAKIGQRKFDSIWLSVKKVLCRLASHSGHKYKIQVSMDVDRMKTCFFNPESESELSEILLWCKNDILAEFKGIAASHKCLNMLETIERVDRERSNWQRSNRIEESSETDEVKLSQAVSYGQIDEESSESYSRDAQTDEVTTIPQGLHYGWTEVRKYGGGIVAAAIWAGLGGAYGMLHGICRTIFFK